MTTEFDAIAYAARLGVIPESFPLLFKAHHVGCQNPDCECGGRGQVFFECTLPSPYSDDPRACLWEPFLMRALGWPTICTYVCVNLRTEYKVNDRMGATWEQTPTAALAAAFDAKEAK